LIPCDVIERNASSLNGNTLVEMVAITSKYGVVECSSRRCN